MSWLCYVMLSQEIRCDELANAVIISLKLVHQSPIIGPAPKLLCGAGMSTVNGRH